MLLRRLRCLTFWIALKIAFRVTLRMVLRTCLVSLVFC